MALIIRVFMMVVGVLIVGFSILQLYVAYITGSVMWHNWVVMVMGMLGGVGLIWDTYSGYFNR